MKGARLIPSVCSVDSPPGEHQIFEALATDADAKGWIVLHSLDLAKHVARTQGEADFVVVIPGGGVVVLEVKSHNSIKYDEHGWWLGTTSTADRRGPFKQASQAMHSIRKYLKGAGLDTNGIPFISAVAFTGVSFNVTSPEWHPWQVIDVQVLHARSISANLLRIVRKAEGLYSVRNLRWASGLSNDVAQIVVRLLRPRFEFLCNPARRMSGLEEDLLRCTEQQFKFLDNAAENERLIVTGLAGTGKTTLAIETLRRERVGDPDSRAALFCFNRLLGDKLRRECSVISKGARCGSFHQFLMELANIKPSLKDTADPEFWSKKLPEIVLDSLTGAAGTAGILDLLILDEAQDLFHDSYLDIFDLLLKGGLADGRWLFFGDFERQGLFSGGAVSLRDFRAKRTKRGAGVFRLDVNCRNTAEISNALTMMAQLNPGYSATLRGDSHCDPALVLYDSRESQVALLEKALDDLLGSGFNGEHIVLLSPYSDDPVSRTLAQSPRWKNRFAGYPAGKGKIGVSTIHAFKGLESPAIVLTSIDNLGGGNRIDLFYVGMSRALHRLHIFAHRSTRANLERNLHEN